MKKLLICSLVAIFIFGAATLALAQNTSTATLVGTVTDNSGAVIAGATITVTNTGTQVVSRGVTNADGAYYVPFLIIGNYELTIQAPGFKKYIQTGLTLNAGETPRIDVKLELGAVTEAINVTGATPLLSTDSAVVGSITNGKAIHDTPIPQSKPQHFMYYMEGALAMNDGTYHILGQPESQLGYTIDGVNAKRSIRSTLGDTNTLVTPPVDSLQEAQVWTTGIPAEIGHSAGGAYNLTTKSGTNEIHFSAEERYINKDWLHRQVFNQGATNSPFEYHNFDAALGGPIYIPKLYDGRNKTFFFLAYRLDYDHEANSATVSVPDQAELNGNFSFGGVGLPIYDPKTITCANSNGCPGGVGYTASPFPGNQIPTNRIDPVVNKFLSFKPYATPNLAGFYTNTGPNNNYISLNNYLSDRQGYVGKIDQQLGSNQKLFVRYAWNKYRVIGSRNNILFNWRDIDNTALGYGLPEPIDERNIALGHVYTINPTLINEFRLSYQRRNDTITPTTQNQGWAGILGIPGVGPQTFPGFVSSGGSSFNWTANPGGGSRTLNEDFTLMDNVTKVFGLHTVKFGYQAILTRENDITATQPSGVYNFGTAGSGLPLTPNTGNSFASFLLGSVTSASFTQLQANYLPRWWTHQFYVQDDWRARRDLTISFGVRYSYEGLASTKYGYKSEFNPNVTDPLTGLMGSITHPSGSIYASDRNNFAPRLGLSWNFSPKWVFRGSFGMFTQDVLPQLGQEEYTAQAVVQQVSGNPFPAFYLQQGPGNIVYPTTSAGTANFLGTNYSQRSATYIDPNLRNPYTMTWSEGFQWEFRPNTLAEVVYQGSSGVGLVGTTNINVLPQSIYSSTDLTLLNAVYANTQNYLPYKQFGSIKETSNFGHSTYHAVIGRVDKRFSSGLSYSFMYTFAKNLAGGAGGDSTLGPNNTSSEVAGANTYYNWRLTKAVTSNDIRSSFVSQASYELPFGKGRRFLDRGGILNEAIGGWTFLTIQSIRSGLPVQFYLAGSPNKYLPGQGNVPLLVASQSVNVPSYSIGPNLWPTTAQNPFYNIAAFANPAAFTAGNAGYGIGRTGAVWWPQYSITKTWSILEKYKVTVRMDANNLFPEVRWLNTASNTVNLTTPQTFGRFPATTGYAFSNWYGQNGTLQGVLRIQF